MTQGITYQDVANAAATLLGQDQPPTLDRIREFLGTGSKSTIAKHFKTWKLKSGEINNTEEVPQELVSLLKGLWDQVKVKGDERITKAEQEAQQEIQQIQEQLLQAQKNQSELQSTCHQLEEKLHEQTRQTQQWQQSFEMEKLAHEKLKVSCDSLIQQRDEQKDEIARLHQLLNHVQTNLEHYQTAMQKLREEQLLETEKQKTTYEREINILKQQLTQTSANANQIQRERDQLITRLDHATQQSNAMTAEITVMQQQLQDKIIHETTLQHRHNDLEKLCGQYQDNIEKLSASNTQHEKNTAVLSDQVECLKKSLQTAEDKIESLRDDKLFLVQEKTKLETLLKQTAQRDSCS